MSKWHLAIAAALSALAASGLAPAEAGPCVLGTGSTAVNNTCIGAEALSSNITGTFNTAVGVSAMDRNTIGSFNTASGVSALGNNTSGESNTAFGVNALIRNTTASNNTAIGVNALSFNTIGTNNMASGVAALTKNTTGSENTASGVAALASNTTGGSNTANGVGALASNTTGNNNAALGRRAAAFLTTGSNNITLGFEAGLNLTTGSNNIIVGNAGNAADLNTIRVGVQGRQTRAFIAGIRGTNITAGQFVVVSADGQLGVTSSSRRYKEDVQPMGNASSPLMQLRPVTFHYRQAEADGSKPVQYGLIAEEVEQVMPDLVVYNRDGTPESVAYQLLPSLLLNEYQKQGRELAETRAELEAMKTEMAALKMAVKHLAAAPSAGRLAASLP